LPSLTGRLVISGDDRFTGAHINADAEGASTRIVASEPGYSPGMETVAPK